MRENNLKYGDKIIYMEGVIVEVHEGCIGSVAPVHIGFMGGGGNQQKFKEEIDRVFPKTTIEDTIPFGKYKGQTYKDIYKEDPQYIDWFLQNNRTLDIDYDSFMSLKQE